MNDLQARLDAYKAAELKVLKMQSVRVAGRDLSLADLGEIRKAIASLEAQLAAQQSGAGAGGGSLRYKTAVFSR